MPRVADPLHDGVAEAEKDNPTTQLRPGVLAMPWSDAPDVLNALEAALNRYQWSAAAAVCDGLIRRIHEESPLPRADRACGARGAPEEAAICTRREGR